jgi:hypothetical protein
MGDAVSQSGWGRPRVFTSRFFTGSLSCKLKQKMNDFEV